MTNIKNFCVVQNVPSPDKLCTKDAIYIITQDINKKVPHGFQAVS